MDKHRKNIGQGLFSETEKAVPRGMPTLDMIKTEIHRLGFWDRDAEDIYDRWLVNGFRTKVGPIRDWRAAIRVMIRHRWLPSQQGEPPGLERHRRYKPEQLEEAARDRDERYKRMERSQGAAREAFNGYEGIDTDLDIQTRLEGLEDLRKWREKNRRFSDPF